jgi:predicted DCC family thiol-disulfide oxidoreductase YuxK
MSELPSGVLARQGTESEAIASATYTVLYDGQCEICQACVSWLRTLDRKHQTVCLPISAETLSSLDPRLNLDACLRQLHVLSPRSDLYVGWDAVATLARLFPSTWLVGELGRRSLSEIWDARYTVSLPATDIPLVNVAAELAV